MKKFSWYSGLIILTILLSAKLFAAKIPTKEERNAPHVVTLDFKKISVRELLQFFAESLNYNLIISDSVTGNVSLHFKQVTFGQALDSLLDMSGLVKKLDHNVLYVGTPADFAMRQQNLTQAALLKSIKVTLRHTDASQACNFLKTQADILSPLAKVTGNFQDNSLWIKESAENLPLVMDFVRQLDQPDKQILITAKIVNVDDKKVNELGVQFSSGAQTKTSTELQASTSEESGNRFNVAIISFAQNHLLNLALDALEKTGHSHIIADPKIIAQNRKMATIEAGEEIPYQEKTSSGATSVTFKKAALSLKVTPTALPDNRIILELEISQNKVSPLSINGTPAIQTQELKTQVIIHNDESVVLGGIYETSCAKVDTAIPGVSSIPLIGSLAGHVEKRQVRKELFILVSPHLLCP